VTVTAEHVEQELMELWSSVEKEKAARQEWAAARQATVAGAQAKAAGAAGPEEDRLLPAAAKAAHDRPSGDTAGAMHAVAPGGLEAGFEETDEPKQEKAVQLAGRERDIEQGPAQPGTVQSPSASAHGDALADGSSNAPEYGMTTVAWQQDMHGASVQQHKLGFASHSICSVPTGAMHGL
jgi:hypothetical protein